MKNKNIFDSWSKIEPDETAEARMLDSILAHAHTGQSEKDRMFSMNKTLVSWRWLAPIAACFVLVVVLVGLFGNNVGWFSGKTLTADLGNGNTLSFYKGSSVGEANFAWDADWGDAINREFTEDESYVLFGTLPVTGSATFRTTDKALMFFEGATGNAKIILSANGHPVTDNVVVGNEDTSEINGIPVTAGYFLTDANSKGIKTIFYFAFFDANGTTVYVKLAGDESDSDTLRTEIGNLIDTLTQNPPDAAAVTF